jgi:ATP-dependent DNA helicase DinG
VLRQGRGLPRKKLIEAFREDVHSVLLGTESFWAGVDVPGEALSCLVIDRLPFPNPSNPVVHMISERTRGAFMTYSVPRTIIALKQGVGRLLRRVTDRGVVVCLDPRFNPNSRSAKRYSGLIRGSLPRFAAVAYDVAAIAEFLDNPSFKAVGR